MIKTSLLTATFCLLAATGAHAAKEAPPTGGFPFKDGDRVVFLGDSITEQRLYSTYLETYLLTRFPGWNLKFRNAGWSGDTSYLRLRGLPPKEALQRDVLFFKPTVVTIKFGMNDAGYGGFDQKLFDAHIAGETAIVQQLKAAGARPVILTPNAVEKAEPGDSMPGYNETLQKFAAGTAALAARENVLFVDQFHPYAAAINRLRAVDPAMRITAGDSVHPLHPGQLLMTDFILTGMNAPSLVSSATINSRKGSVTASEGAKITDIVRKPDGISFRRLDKALVFPIEPAARPALSLAPVADDINRYMVRVTNLQPGAYTLSVNGQEISRFSAAQLSGGVNLGSYDGPLTAPGTEILKHVRRKNDIYYVKWRQVQLGNDPEAAKQTQIQAFDKEILEQETIIDSLRKPPVFQFEIKRAIMPPAPAVTPAKP